MPEIRAITLDLDDTLWPIEPVLELAETRLYQWLFRHCGEVASCHTLESMRRNRLEIAQSEQTIAHDLTEIRRRSLHHIIVTQGGYPANLVDLAMAEFLDYRNRVELYSDTLPFLRRAGQCLPLASISNGNADPGRIGLSGWFVTHVAAIEVGAAKPDARVFEAACDRLGLEAREVLHIGDHPVQDILGAAQIGMKTVWLNRTGACWDQQHRPDYEVRSLDQVLELLHLEAPGDPE